MRTTLTIDDDVIELARILAREEGRSIGSVVSRLARSGLRGSGRVMTGSGADALPAFEVPENAEVITAETVRRALDE